MMINKFREMISKEMRYILLNKARRIVVGIVSIIFISLWIMKVDIPKNLFIVLMGIVLISRAIDEWIIYKETKRRIHLFIPITLEIGRAHV